MFGSFASAEPEPRDIDIALVMATDFKLEEAPRESRTLFSHPDAEAPLRCQHLLGPRRDAARGYDAGVARDLADEAGRHEAWNTGGHRMIRTDVELAVMRDRVARLEKLLETLRASARLDEWPALSSGYRLEIERMQGEILDYLVHGAPPLAGARA